jgi:GNAT superfamily N-acetyltransferase
VSGRSGHDAGSYTRLALLGKAVARARHAEGVSTQTPDQVTAATRVVAVDPRDDGAFGQWYRVTTAGLLHDRPDDDPPGLEEHRAKALAGLPEREPSELIELLLAVVDGRAVGAVSIELPLRDNPHVSYAEGHVLPAARRRGVGRALLDAVLDRSRGAGRSLLMTELDEPPGCEDRSDGRAFLRATGFTEALVEARRDLALPVPADVLDRLERECAPHAVDYELLTWRDRCPDELVEGRAELGRAMSTAAPLGELDWHEETWDAARVREREQLVAEQGRTSVIAAARHRPSGQLVGFTELVARPARPQQAHQWETLVLREHRGHRLGMLLKIAALRRLVAELPGARVVQTGNALVNGPMIAVNEALGFRVAGTYGTWQRPV